MRNLVPIVPPERCGTCHPSLYPSLSIARLCEQCYDQRFPPCSFCGVHHHEHFGPPACESGDRVRSYRKFGLPR